MEVQINHVTKLAYQGNNQAELLKAKEEFGYSSNEWMTFLQANSVNRKVKKGSKSVAIFKGYQDVQVKGKNKKGEEVLKDEKRPLGNARVFNLDQTEPRE